MGKGLREDFELVRQMESTERLESTLTKLGLKADQIDEVWEALSGFLPAKSKHDGEDKSGTQVSD